MYPCVNCNNKFKTEQGLLRHMSAKHDSLNNVKLEKDELMVLIEGAASKLTSDDCFPSIVRYWLRNISFDNISNTRAIQFARIHTSLLINIEKILDRPITKFYNSDDVNVIAPELRLTKTRPISFYVKHNLS